MVVAALFAQRPHSMVAASMVVALAVALRFKVVVSAAEIFSQGQPFTAVASAVTAAAIIAASPTGRTSIISATSTAPIIIRTTPLTTIRGIADAA